MLCGGGSTDRLRRRCSYFLRVSAPCASVLTNLCHVEVFLLLKVYCVEVFLLWKVYYVKMFLQSCIVCKYSYLRASCGSVPTNVYRVQVFLLLKVYYVEMFLLSCIMWKYSFLGVSCGRVFLLLKVYYVPTPCGLRPG